MLKATQRQLPLALPATACARWQSTAAGPILPVREFKPKYTQLFINNEFVNGSTGKAFADINPANKQIIAEIQEANQNDVNKSVSAARAAFELGTPWRKMDPSDRCSLMHKLADLMERDTALLATMETLDMGKPFSAAVDDVVASIKWIRYYAGYVDKLYGHTIPVDGDYFCYTRMEPIGVVGCILPWNYPLMILCWKLAPALATGCTSVVKPAEQTPLSALHFAALAREAGIPPGVVNIVNGHGNVGAALANHMDIDKLSFTGSTEVGRKVLKASAESNLKKVTLELGGKSPNIVFSDVDLDFAVEQSHFALFFNMGQDCTAGSRCYVQEDIYDAFVEKSVERARKRVVGDPFAEKTESGPQVDEDQYHKILDMIASGRQEGAKLVTGGSKLGDKGYFIESTVFADVKDDHRIAKEEIFGPVQQIIKFKNVDEVIPRANNTTYGLAASVFTNDLNKALKVAHSVRAGTMWVNCYHVETPFAPFGGYKESGIGREHGEAGLKEFCEFKSVYVHLPEKTSTP
jgi:retinal dehydrogenase